MQVNSTGSASSMFGYTGQQTDTSGMQFLRARYYQPSAGRFLNQDTFAGYADLPQSLNHYAYGLNNPVLYSDPSGQFVWPNNLPALGSPLGAGLDQFLQFRHDTGPCMQWDQLAMFGGAAAVALMMQAQALRNASGDFTAGFFSELLRANFWWIPPVQANLAIKTSESTAMLVGRMLGAATSIGIGLLEVEAGVSGGIGGTIFGCGTTACAASPAAVGIGGVVVIYGGVTALSGARDLGGALAVLLGRGSGSSPRPNQKYPTSELPTQGRRYYIPPKQNGDPEIVKAGQGYIDKWGNIWEWAKDQHGGPHWDVTHPDGSHTNVAPDGNVIGSDRFPNVQGP